MIEEKEEEKQVTVRGKKNLTYIIIKMEIFS